MYPEKAASNRGKRRPIFPVIRLLCAARGLGIQTGRVQEGSAITSVMTHFYRAVSITAVVLLAGCLPGGRSQTQTQPAATAVRSAELLQGRIGIETPAGYCVDTSSLRNHPRAGFVLIAGCDGLMGLPAGTLVKPAILTVSALVPRDGGADVQDMLRALEPEDVLSQSAQDGLLLVEVSSPDLVPDGGAPHHWRAAMVQNEALLTLAVYGDQSIGSRRGKALLIETATKIRAASANRVKKAAQNAKNPPKSLFQRIFN